MPYSSASRVAAMIPNLLNNASNFTDLDTVHNVCTPGSAYLVGWQSAGCALIETKLKAAGFSTPVAVNDGLYDFIADTEATYVAYRAERANTSGRLAPGERGRAGELKHDFDSMLAEIVGIDLARAGMAYTAQWYVGGISDSEKDSVESDTDRVTSMFTRGQFANREVFPPDGNELDDDQER